MTVAEEISIEQTVGFLDSVIENIPDMIFVKDASELRFVRFNKAGEELLGIPRSEMIGKNDYDFFPKEQADFFTASDRKVLAGATVVEILEEQISTRAHGMRWLHTKKIPIRDENGQPVFLLGISEDITEKKLAEERRVLLLGEREARKLAEKSSALLRDQKELRERFVAMIAHDLRSPLSGARASGELILRNADKPETCRKLASRIIEGIDRIDKMIRDLLDANQIQAGHKLQLSLASIDLCAVVRKVLEEYTVMHGNRFPLDGVKCSVQGYWSEDGLRRIVENLVGNAIKYGEPNKPIVVSVMQEDDSVVLSVHNEGPCLSNKEKENLFRLFRRGKAVMTPKKTGWGIGLTLVQGATHAHGGTVDVQSDKGGTTFLIRLPRDARPFQNHEQKAG